MDVSDNEKQYGEPHVQDDSSMDEDAAKLAAMGYSQDMTRKFSILSLLAVGFSLTNSWFGISASLITGINSGGPVLTIYGIPWIAFISTCVGITLSELASAMPNAGGQYFWASELAPRKHANFASYLTGWFAWTGSIFTSASVALSLGLVGVGMYQLAHPDFVPKAWHAVLAYQVINTFAFLFNCVGKLLPKVATVTLYTSLISFITILITVPAKAKTHQSPEFVFATFINSTGWKSNGIAYLVGLINCNWVFACLDSATHMAEEVARPEKAIPIAIMGTVAIGFTTAWCFVISMFFSLNDFDKVVNSATGVPILELFHQALGSRTGAIALQSLILATGMGCQIASHTWQSRLCWSFARDRGLPFHALLSKIDPRLDVPFMAHSVSCFIVGILGLLYLGSSAAFNSMVTACIVLLYVSYAIPIICLLIRGRNNISHGPFWLGKLGMAANIIVLAWTCFTIIMFSFPSVYPVQVGNMNYVSVVYMVVIVVIVIDWFARGRREFRGQSTRHTEVDLIVRRESTKGTSYAQQGGIPPQAQQSRLSQEALDMKNTRDSAHESMGLLQSTGALRHEKRKFLPPWLRKKRCFALLIVLILAVGTTLAVLGGLGRLGDLGKKKSQAIAPKDGLSPPWYPTPKGGTVSNWSDSYKKAQKMVERMSLSEKVNVTTGVGWQMGLCVGNTGPATSVGFPSLCLQDGPLGLRFADNITAFPAGITVGATWDRDLMRKRGRLLGVEARLKGVNVLLGPALGPLGTLPAGGRNWEGFGSDPVLQGVAAAETIRGIQELGVIATAKHYVLNEQEHYRQPHEWGIPNAMSSNIDDRTLREVYIWPFAESVRAGVASIMCAYQMVNNSYSCGNSLLLNGILKDELGFQGFVQSDWWAQQAGVSTALAGLDMSMPGGGPRFSPGVSYWGSNLTLAALNTSVPMERINDMATRIVAAWYQMKQDTWPKPAPEGDGGPNFSSWTRAKVGRLHEGSDDKDAVGVVNKFVNAQGEGDDAHGLLARRIAAESTILLKNEDNILPLSRDGNSRDNATYRVGIYGEDAGPGKGPNFCLDRACNQGTLGSGWGSGAVEFPYLITPGKALSQTFNNASVKVSLHYENEISDVDLKDKELCIVFVNSNGGEGFASDGDIRGDRNDLFLQKGGNRLIKAVASRCGKGSGHTIVVIHAVGPVVMESWADEPNIKGIILANLPGQESGNAIADFLFGNVDACGRLPYTIGKNLDDYGPESQVLYKTDDPVPQKDFSHGLYTDYRYFDRHNITPRYEFGFGLSYTSFNFSDLTITPLQNKTALPSPRPESDVSPPSYDNQIPSVRDSLFPNKFRRLSKYIYPYISSERQVTRGSYDYPVGYNITQQPSQAGGGEGGNPSLFEPFVNISVVVTNIGRRAGKEVVQLYVSFPQNVTDVGNPTTGGGNTTATHGTQDSIDFPIRVLREFRKVELDAGKSATVNMSLTRKDLSFWSTRRQNWVMPTEGAFRIWVGNSSRALPLAGRF
ncbi:hypothetical protein LOZ61_006076 [Ophidiomyces ophidiicola]|nr:hypothetical protein LOZ61_006076 [Ophidiomyces ophidiicola]KAI1922782.1 hypothetical protein LOZ60_005550 [Ophidiomyces ophidiicola]